MINAYMIIGIQDGPTYYAIDIVKNKAEADALANRLEGYVEPIEDYNWENEE